MIARRLVLQRHGLNPFSIQVYFYRRSDADILIAATARLNPFSIQVYFYASIRSRKTKIMPEALIPFQFRSISTSILQMAEEHMARHGLNPFSIQVYFYWKNRALKTTLPDIALIPFQFRSISTRA